MTEGAAANAGARAEGRVAVEHDGMLYISSRDAHETPRMHLARAWYVAAAVRRAVPPRGRDGGDAAADAGIVTHAERLARVWACAKELGCVYPAPLMAETLAALE